MEIMILGATGLVGGALLNLALNEESISRVIVLTRKPLLVSSQKLEQILLDFDDLEEHKLAFKVDQVYCCLGTTIKKAGNKVNFKKVDFEFPYRAGVLAKESGVMDFFILTALGANEKSPIFYSKVKGEIENHLREIQFLTLGVVRPSLIIGERTEVRKGERIGQGLMKTINPYLPGPLKKFRGVEAIEVAKILLSLGKKESVDTFIEYKIFKRQKLY